MSTNYRIEALIDEAKDLHTDPGMVGSPVEITYAFWDNTPATGQYLFEPVDGFEGFDIVQRMYTRLTLEDISEYSGLSFREVQGGADLQFGFYTGRPGIPADVPSDGETLLDWRTNTDQPTTRDIWINHETERATDFEIYGDGKFLMTHELGHALGLKHPGSYSQYDDGPYLPTEEDSGDNTVMSYNQDGTFSSGFRPYDVEALQYLYGSTPSTDPTAVSDATSTALSGYEITVEFAQTFLKDNIDNPVLLNDVSEAFDLSAAIFADLLGQESFAMEEYLAGAAEYAALDAQTTTAREASEAFLANYGIEWVDAREFVNAHQEQPQAIFDAAISVGLDAYLIGGIAGTSETDVLDWFSSSNLDVSLIA